LLTGDIEAAGEQRLLAVHGGSIASTIVVAPHHGSRSSSTPPLVRATRAQFVVFPVGYRNRWRFPDAGVVARWQAAGAQTLRTDHDGAVRCHVQPERMKCEGHRWRHRRYWRSR
jgi:competence protein ComEC